MSKNTRNRILLTAVAALLLVVMAVGGTMAWLAAESSTITNTFDPTNIGVKLEETKNDFDMIPGSTIDKDPKATVLANSVDSYLFVKLVKGAPYDTYLEPYVMADDWIQLTDADNKPVEGVYYREVAASTTDQSFQVLANDKVTVKTSVTKKLMEDISGNSATKPTLIITAYAVQKANLTPQTAWAAIADPDVNPSSNTTPEGYPAE